MADSYNKKERDKKRKKRKKDKLEKKAQRKVEGVKQAEFMYLDEDGNLSPTPPDPTKKRKEIKLEDINISTPKQEDIEVETERKGYVKFFNQEKRFGFIREKGTEQDYFVHEENCIEKIKDNDKVVFEVTSGPKGLVAINVKIQKKEEKKKTPPPVEKEGAEAPEAAKTEEVAKTEEAAEQKAEGTQEKTE